METNRAARAFAVLGHPGRLAVLRLLMRFAPRGVRPTEIAAALDLRPNTLSHHLSDLAAAGLVTLSRQGRNLLYAADLEAAEALVGYLALDLGRGRPTITDPLAATPAATGARAVLFLCSGNSARSILAEALLRDLGKGQFRAHSAGTRARSHPHPLALEVLTRHGHGLGGLCSKPVDLYRQPDAPTLDFVFTVCDTAAAEDCPPWPGRPVTGHWGLPDPALASGTETERLAAFDATYAALRRKIAAFVDLPHATLDRLSLQSRIDAIATPTPEKA